MLYRSLARNWALQDSLAVEEFAKRMNPGTDRDHLLAGLMASTSPGPEQTAEILLLIDDPGLREQAEQTQETQQRIFQGR